MCITFFFYNKLTILYFDCKLFSGYFISKFNNNVHSLIIACSPIFWTVLELLPRQQIHIIFITLSETLETSFEQNVHNH